MKNIGIVLISFSLILLAIILIIVLVIPAIIWKIYVTLMEEDRKIRNILKGTSKFFKALAVTLDVFGGVAYSGLFNKYLLIDGIYRFGNPYETISEVLGWGEYYNDLTPLGKYLVKVLDKIDKNHCRNTRLYGVHLAKAKLRLLIYDY